MHRRLVLAGVLVVAFAAAAVPAFAKGGKPSDPSITLNGPTNGASVQPSLGSTVTFTTTYPSSTKNPRVQVLCYQNGALVYGESGSPDYAFVLGGGSSQWLANGGPANCEADLLDVYYQGGQQQVVWLASTTFNAAG
jgi:hypothetical protein